MEFQPVPLTFKLLGSFLSEKSLNLQYEFYLYFIEKLKNVVKEEEIKETNIENIVNKYIGAAKNYAAQILNYEFFWKILTDKQEQKIPIGNVYNIIVKEFGSFDKMKERFNNFAVNHFGSGWIYLVYDPKFSYILIIDGDDSYNPISDGYIPILCLNVWEHSYVLDYGTDKESYVKNFWDYVNWNYIYIMVDDFVY